MLQRMRELAVQAANDTLTSQDRSYIQMEIDELKAHIDRIANTTQFNKMNILDGSVCGSVVSSDTTTKAYVRGAIKNEGNYRLEIKADPGQAQVQKTNIFKIKHENVVTNKQTDTLNGIGDLKIDGIPAGDYSITGSMGQGGPIKYMYEATLEGEATEPNDTGRNEVMTLTFTAEDGKSSSFSFDLGSNLDSEEKIAEEVVKQINEKGTITVGGQAVTLKATLKEDGRSYSIKATGNPHIVRMRSNVSVSTASKGSAVNPVDCDYIDYRVFKVPQIATVDATVNISYGGRSASVSVSQGQTQQVIAENVRAQLASLGVTGASIEAYRNDPPFPGTSYKVNIGKVSETPNLRISVTTEGTASWATPGLGTEQTAENYRINANCTVSHGNDSGGPEGMTITFTDGTNTASVEVEIPDGTAAADIPALISAKLNTELGNALNWGGNTINFDVADNGDGTFTIKSRNRDSDVWPRQIRVSIAGPSSVTAKGAAQADEVEEELITVPYSEADALAVLTGSYNIDPENVFDIKLEGASGKAENNASILFQVLDKSYDPLTGAAFLTLSATSQTLGVDGKAAGHSIGRITLTSERTSVQLGALLGENDDHLTLSLKDALDIDSLEAGSKFVYNICGVGSASKGVTADTSIFVAGKQDSTWPYKWDDYEESVTLNGKPVQYNLNAKAVSAKDIEFVNFYLDSDSGRVHTGAITLSTRADFADAAANFTAEKIPLTSFRANYVGKIAEGDTKLRDLEPFWNKSGVFMLEQPQTITISQNDGKKAQITLHGYDTLNDVRQKLNDAIAYDLNQSLYVSGGDANKIVTFVEDAAESTGLETVKGTFLIRSLIPGQAGELTFSSSFGGLIDSLGLNTVKEAHETSYNVSIFNAHDNSILARNVKTSGNVLEGVIDDNIDVVFDPMPNVQAVWSEADRNFMLVPENDSYSVTLHVVKNNITFQTGTHEGEEITLDIGDMSSASIGISGVNVMTHERAANAITTIDAAMRHVSSQRSKLGTYQNALEHTMETLTVTNENMTVAESGIRDADMSKSLMELVKFRIINQSSTSMLAQANQLSQSVMNLMQN